jgi:hypothetical protein
MATMKNRIEALEDIKKNIPFQPSPEYLADHKVASQWFHANGCKLDLLPREDMTKGERNVLEALISIYEKI